MKRIRLRAISDEFDSSPGLVIAGQPIFDGLSAAREGVLLAHDILEHQNGPDHIGKVWDEFEALGALWHVRGRHGDMVTKRPSIWTPEQNIASDVTRMFSEWYDGDTGPGGDGEGSRPCEADDAFTEILAIARHDIPKESFEWCEGDGERLNDYLAFGLRRMRIGYRKAVRKYGHGYEGINLFRLIAEAVDDGMRSVEFEGQEFDLHCSTDRAWLEERYTE